MQEIIDYDIVLCGEEEGLGVIIGEVKGKIKQGWQPLGAPFECGKDLSYIAQAVVKYSEK